MTDKSRFDLDAAFAALERDERAARPAPSQALVARVLADAAAQAPRRMSAARAVPAPDRSGGLAGWLGWLGFGDIWAGVTAAAVVLVLAAGFGFGYQAGPQALAATGLAAPAAEADFQQADAGDAIFDGEDVL